MLPKILETKKLFYRKYAFKVCCLIEGARFVSAYGSYAPVHALEWERKYGHSGFSRSSKIDIVEYREFVDAVLPFLSHEDVKIRTEGRHFNLFCTDKAVYEDITKRLGKWTYELSAPKTDKDLEFLLNSQAIKVIVDQLPYEKYKYKIVLKSSMKPDTRLRLKTWMSKYSEDDMTISSRTTYDWMKGNKPYAQDPFIYVAEDKVRTMVELYLGTNKARTEEFVLRSSI